MNPPGIFSNDPQTPVVIARNTRFLKLLISLFVVGAGVAPGCNKSGITDTNRGPAPEVVSTNPQNKAEAVPVNTTITAIFSEKMDTTSITPSTFLLKKDTIQVTGVLSYTDSSATFIPSTNLDFGSIYSAAINAEIKNATGNTIQSSYEWEFSTENQIDTADTTPPQIVSTKPATDEEGVGINSAITVVFSETMNASTLNTSTFTITQGTTAISGLVTAAGATATFSPFSNLTFGETYHAVVSAEVEDKSGNTLPNNFEWRFKTVGEPDTTPPRVNLTDPAENESNVPVTTIITATFSEPMDHGSINNTTFKVTQDKDPVSGSIDFSGVTAIFTPADSLAFDTPVTVVVTTGAQDSAGNALRNDVKWSFRTEKENIPPKVSSVSPSGDAQNVSVNTLISATFNEPIDPASINATTIQVSLDGTPVQGSVNYSNPEATFRPDASLKYNRTYTVSVTTGVKDLAGNNLSDNVTWSFMTEQETIPPEIISTFPKNKAKDVSITSIISATFSEPMDPSTINLTTVTVLKDGLPVGGTIDYTDNTVIFTPAIDLDFGKTYNVIVTTGAQDLAGNPLKNAYLWSFSTSKGLLEP